MRRAALLSGGALALASGCTPKTPFDDVEAGKSFTHLDSLPSPMRKDDWKTLSWLNVDAKRMDDDGGTCKGHIGVLERSTDKQHWLLIGATCGGTSLLSDTGARLDGHPLKTFAETDHITVDAKFVEALAQGRYVLWAKTRIVRDKQPESSAFTDNLVIRRKGTRIDKILEIGNEAVRSSDFEGTGFPKDFVVRADNEEYRTHWDENDQRYSYKSYLTFLGGASDAGAPASSAPAPSTAASVPPPADAASPPSDGASAPPPADAAPPPHP